MALVSALLIATLAGIPRAPLSPDPNYEKTIANYFVYVRESVQAAIAESSRPKTEGLPRTFPFEAIRQLRAEELLRGAFEGVRDARLRYARRSKEEADRYVTANVQLCLEYYPLVARGEEDLKRILRVVEDLNLDSTYRLFVLRRCVPDLAPRSLLSDYLVDGVRKLPQEMKRILSGLVESKLEDGPVQATAIEVLYRVSYEYYLKRFQKDPNVLALAKTREAPVTPRILIESKEVQLSRMTAMALQGITGQFADLANLCATHLDPSSNRPPEVKQAALGIIERVYNEIPVQDRAAVKALLDKYAPAAPESNS